jgi:hypothetical protein
LSAKQEFLGFAEGGFSFLAHSFLKNRHHSAQSSDCMSTRSSTAAQIASLRLIVLNPGGNDPDQGFPNFGGMPNDRLHAPVNYHAYAACTGGSFCRALKPILEQPHRVLLVLRWDLKGCLTVLNKLKKAGSAVAVSVKESGLHQIAALLESGENLALFNDLCAQADGCISSTQELVPIYQSAGAKRVEFIPTPYPVEDRRWDFALPVAHRRGIFLGTREFDIPSRNHAAALLLAKSLGEPITVINTEGRSERKLLAGLRCEWLNIVDGPMPYSRYLRLLSKHKIVFQLDRSAVPGQVAGDALLCRVPCVGGDSAIERLVFSEWHGYGRSFEEITHLADQLLHGEGYDEAVEKTHATARKLISFSVVAKQLEAFFRRIETDA